MARRRGYTTYRDIRGLARRPIRIPQPTVRPIHILFRKAIKSERLAPDAWWFVLHRRGIRRPSVGEDPLEARAVSEKVFNGTLPERIVYRYLVNVLRLTSGVDFTAQSSLQGGRLEMGGIVADFVFPILKFVIQVQGPTHETFIRQRKDEEQRDMLSELGYNEVYALSDDLIYCESEFDAQMRRIFNIRPGYSSNLCAGGYSGANEDRDSDKTMLIYQALLRIEASLRSAI